MKTIVNEYLSEEEKNEFKSKKIPNPAFGLDYLSPKYGLLIKIITPSCLSVIKIENLRMI